MRGPPKIPLGLEIVSARHMRAVFVALLVVHSLSASAFYIELHGVVTEYFTGEPMKGVQVRMVKDGIERETVITKSNGEYEFVLDRGYVYLIWFYKDGWVTKHIRIDASGIPPIPDVPFYDMDVQVSMFEWVEGVDLGIFEEPLGLAEYVHSVRKLTWDIEYTELRRPKVAHVMERYERVVNVSGTRRRPKAPASWPPATGGGAAGTIP